MKIAYFLVAFPDPSETFILRQITGMIERGHEIDIYALARGKSKIIHPDVHRYGLLDKTHYFGSSSQTGVPNLVRSVGQAFGTSGWRSFTRLQVPFILLKQRHKARSLGMPLAHLLLGAATLMSRGPYDVLHCQFGTLGPLILFLKEITSTTGKLVVSFRGYDATKYVQNRPGFYDGLFEAGDLFLPVSESLAQRIIALGCDRRKVRVLHSGVNCSELKYSERLPKKGKPVRLLTIARLVEKKGIAYAIDAVSQIVRSGRAVTYSVVGDGPLRAKLESLTQGLDLTSTVHFIGWKSHEEVIQLIHEAHLIIAPSVTAADGDQEGIPNCLKEAMALGRPVIGTLHGGIPELIVDGESGLLVPERDANALGDRLVYLVDNPERWRVLGGAARARVEAEFDIHKLNHELEKLYAS